jgi:predicted Zn-dependent peptidase
MKRFVLALGLFGIVAACAGRAPNATSGATKPPPPPAVDASAPVKRVTPDAPFRAAPPPATDDAPFVPPAPTTLRLRNGIPLTLVRQPTGIVSIAVVASGGISEMSADKVELLDITLATATTETKKMDSDAFEDALGAALMQRIRWSYFGDGVVVAATMIGQKLQAGVDLLADSLLRPAFRDTAFAWHADVLAREIEEEATNDSVTADRTLRRLVFGKHAYATTRGTSANARAAKRTDAIALHAQLFDPSRMSIVAAGGIDEKAVFAAIDAAFGGLPRRGKAPPAPPTPTTASGARIVVVDRPGASVARIEIGFLGPSAGASDSDASELAVRLLGDTTVGRLALELREKRRAAVFSWTWWRFRSSGLLGFTTTLPPADVAGALGDVARLTTALGTDGPTNEELGVLRDGFAASFGASIGTASGTAWTYATAAVVGLAPDSVNERHKRLAAVDASAVRAVAGRWLTPGAMRVVVVGDWAAMRESVSALGWSVSVTK